ncbi:peptidase domain-containing ABC transporter [Rudanella lutea]|uniref:peptidase domain-containing ABC transporter n=1 Tax=Rudanella lutea TaxID=451374 RepID=UPI0003795FF1|nr:peptidase domain-containing ABC transporter [Rudanella lutea]
MAFTFHRQLDFMDCGPTCLKMVAGFYGRDYSLDYLRANAHITKQGVSLMDLNEAAEKIGFKTLPVRLSVDQLLDNAPLPCILHWNSEHFVVLHKVLPARWGRKQARFVVADPAHDMVSIDRETFMHGWCGAEGKGIALLLEPTPAFYEQSALADAQPRDLRFLYQYLRPYKRYIIQILFGMLFSSVLALIMPFLTQGLVDYGIQRQDFRFIHLVLFSQLILFLGSIGVDLIRNWILLHVNTRVSVSIISNFLVKLMKLPIQFYDSKNIGDISQRISDHHRIESFLTGSTLQMLFSLVNLVVFSAVLGMHSLPILGVFALGSGLTLGWTLLFLRRRKNLDYKRFQRLREHQNSIYEIITGMYEIKLNHCERRRRWDWERIQAKLFKINIESLALEQYQEVGATCLTQLKNILVSYMAAIAVMEHEFSLGVMLSISYIVGQMNEPIAQLSRFLRNLQDARVSIERLGEIHNRPDEDEDEDERAAAPVAEPDGVSLESFYESQRLNTLLQANALRKNTSEGIRLRGVTFRYGGQRNTPVLRTVDLTIPKGKVTAIVGASGSGKTTLLKLLLKFYTLNEGDITVEGRDLNQYPAREWRRRCGTVMQEGYIFSDTIARNIAVDGEPIDEARFRYAIRVANLDDFVQRLPLGFATRIGNTGAGLSGGQKQRIFIARAVYKNPDYLFFDEATSALDANNERIVMDNLQTFFKDRTVLVIAHRLSTVMNADQIVVLDKGEVVEVGTHHELTVMGRGHYYELVKNQLQLETL